MTRPTTGCRAPPGQRARSATRRSGAATNAGTDAVRASRPRRQARAPRRYPRRWSTTATRAASRTAMRSTLRTRAARSCRAESIDDNIEASDACRLAHAIRRRHRDTAWVAGSLRCLRRQRHAAGYPDTQHVHPPFMKIEQVRVEQRGEHVLHHDEQSDPGDEALAAEQQQMHQPHRVQQDDPDRSPLHRDVQGLVVRIADDPFAFRAESA